MSHTPIFSVLFEVSEISPVVFCILNSCGLFTTQSTCFSELFWSSVEIRLALLNIFVRPFTVAVYFTLHHNRQAKSGPPVCRSHQIPIAEAEFPLKLWHCVQILHSEKPLPSVLHTVMALAWSYRYTHIRISCLRFIYTHQEASSMG